jgi:CDP-2,3-bis-(O-geranylgeranyl)-sn-glycerol synthase
MLFIVQALYFFLPAYLSNAAPVLLSKINVLPQPVDLNKTWNGQPFIGPNKTWGGLLYGTITGTLIFILQQKLYTIPFFQSLSIMNYTEQPILLGFLLAFGALFGDLAKSFIKRRLNKQPGSSWFPFDQLDYVIGAFLFSAAVYLPELSIILTIIILAPFLHFIANRFSYVLGLKKVRW